ncbi:antibiotic biosynthesis monooxygenase [Colwelliaceae bacterium 6471]
MIAVIFEVTPKEGATDRYFEIAGDLKQVLSEMDGFISIERFQSVTTPSRYLSLSFWQDEKSVKLWRNQFAHRQAQNEGRNNLFKDYRLRVANVLRDYGLDDRQQSPVDIEQ